MAERQAAWQALSEEEQWEKVRDFLAVVAPRVRRSVEEMPGPGPGAPARQVVGSESEGVFRLPVPPSSGAHTETPVFRGTTQNTLAPCLTRDCQGGGSIQVLIAANPTSGPAPLTVQFSSLVYPTGSFGLSYFWSFGDGATSSLANPAHTYTVPGSYLVSVEVTDAAGGWAWDSVPVSVAGQPGNQPPVVSLRAAPTSGPAPLSVSFTASASDPDGSIHAYRWIFGDGSTASGSASRSHVYGGAGSFLATVEVTDDQGATASATVAVEAFSAGGDADLDGLDDALEDTLAQGFMPYYHVSDGERAGTGFARFRDTTTLQISQNLPASPPAVHWRVTPLFTALANGVSHQFLQVDYLTVWNRDDGLDAGGLCQFNASILGGLTGYAIADLIDGLGNHAFDQERSAVLLAAPVVSAHDPAAYRAYHYYAAAHEGTPFDYSTFLAPPVPLPAGNHLELWLSRSKHASYAGNPNYLPLVPSWLIYLTYVTIDELYFYFGISYWEYLYYLAIADSVFYTCVVERFGEQGGVFPGLMPNVGERGRPLNGSAWIADPRIAAKLQPLWILVP